MPNVHFGPHVVDANPGERLRDALLRAGTSPHNGRANLLNCRGFGTCGTCAVRIEGPVEPAGMRERARLRVPPHDPDAGLRLACQVRVGTADLTVRKHPGFWGQHTDQPPVVG